MGILVYHSGGTVEYIVWEYWCTTVGVWWSAQYGNTGVPQWGYGGVHSMGILVYYSGGMVEYTVWEYWCTTVGVWWSTQYGNTGVPQWGYGGVHSMGILVYHSRSPLGILKCSSFLYQTLKYLLSATTTGERVAGTLGGLSEKTVAKREKNDKITYTRMTEE